MTNNTSKKHHYIPVFYLNNFTNLEGAFYIYKVKERVFKKGGKLFTPKSHFFVENGNTFEQYFVPNDFLETKFYSPIDNDVAALFEKVKKSSHLPKYGLSDLEIVQLEHFFGHLYWRNPSRDGHVKHLIENRNLQQLGLKLKNGNKISPEFEQSVKEHPDFFKIIKSILPDALFGNYKYAMDHKFVLLEYPKGLPGILGDNPVILKQRSHNNYVEDMLVPITKELVFSRNSKEVKFIDINVKIMIDMMLLMQANEFVCVTDKTYIQQLEDTYNEVITGGIENLRQLLFHGLEKDHGNIEH